MGHGLVVMAVNKKMLARVPDQTLIAIYDETRRKRYDVTGEREYKM
jgi:hypothetical protein